MIYVDSSALVCLYIPEPLSPAARAIVYGAVQVPFTALHDRELANAFERLVGRGLITRQECRAEVRQVSDDIEARRFARVTLDFETVFAAAIALSRRYTTRFLTRRLDWIHVAAARHFRRTRFVSADDRRLAVAKASGLTIVDLKSPSRQRPR
jgi:predicted nucleic acid-binding protein